MSTLFTRKPISELLAEGEGVGEDGRPNSLRRVLGAGDLIMLAIGAVIGAGIFSSIGTAAAGEILPDGVVVRYGAGPALVVSFILLGLASAGWRLSATRSWRPCARGSASESGCSSASRCTSSTVTGTRRFGSRGNEGGEIVCALEKQLNKRSGVRL